MVASFVKRLAKVAVSGGLGVMDTMCVIAVLVNLIKRTPKCEVMLSSKEIEFDPFLDQENDPLKTKALESSLWEAEILLKKHYDKRVRDFTSVLTTDFTGKNNFFSPEDFVQVDSLDALKKDIENIDTKITGEQVRVHLITKQILGKRQAEKSVREMERQFRE